MLLLLPGTSYDVMNMCHVDMVCCFFVNNFFFLKTGCHCIGLAWNSLRSYLPASASGMLGCASTPGSFLIYFVLFIFMVFMYLFLCY